MHVTVFADLEGSFGIWRMRQCRTGTRAWQYGRECLTDDVNCVVDGAFHGGADKVTVKDTHDTGFNCLVEKLDRRARYVGGHYTQPTFFGDITSYDLVLYVAIHAASGTPDAFFPHTHYGVFSKLKINDKPVCEMELYGAYLGEFGLPVGFVSGEAIAVKQALSALPWAESVVVDKRKEAYMGGEKTIHYLKNGREELQKAAAKAVMNVSRMQPFKIPGPIHFEAEFRTEELAAKFNTWNFPPKNRSVEWDAKDMVQGFEMLNKLTFFPKKTYLVRRPMAFIFRNTYRIKSRCFSPDPDNEGAPSP